MEKLFIPLIMVGLVVYNFIRQRRAMRPKPKAVAPAAPLAGDSLLPAEALRHASWQTRLSAIDQIMHTPDGLEQLLPLLQDPDFDVREKARKALVEYGSSAVPGLLDVLERGNLNARQAAAEALAGIGDPASVDGLHQALTTDISLWVRAAAAHALGAIGGDAAVRTLHDGRADSDQYVREAVASALEQHIASAREK